VSDPASLETERGCKPLTPENVDETGGSPPPRQLPSGKNRRRYFGQEQDGKEDRLRTITDAEVIASSEKDPRLFGAIFERHYGR